MRDAYIRKERDSESRDQPRRADRPNVIRDLDFQYSHSRSSSAIH